jgi:tRNA threonylcarbamoyl adenosine modification protein (Sua5/YciO/YrdC/YwlC family)/dephospho-CoA kinase
MVPGPEAFSELCEEVPGAAYALAERFWPGPLTIVLHAKPSIPPIVLAGGDTVGLRCPDSEKTLALLRACGLPLAAPSANPSGAPSPKTADEVSAYFDGAIDAVIDGGACELGTESTIVSLTGDGLTVLRHGALPEEEIRRCLIDTLTIFGVTGGSGVGKTTMLNVLREKGALVIDADEVYYGLCRDSVPMLAEIETRFPGVVEGGVLQRKKLGSVVFADAQALEDLRRITDVYVEREIDRLLSDHAANGGRYAAVDAINILGTKLETYATATIAVTAPEETRVARLVAREGITEEYARLRIRAQRPDSYFEEHCTYTIRNDGSKEDFRRRCGELISKLMED